MSVFAAAADPVSVAPGSLEGESWCNEHMLHERLDIIEEVRGTVLAPEPYQTPALSFLPKKRGVSRQCPFLTFQMNWFITIHKAIMIRNT